MPLFLSEEDVLALLPMERAIERVTAAMLAEHEGQASNRARQRIFMPASTLHYMAANFESEHLVGLKIYTVSRSAVRFLVLLYDSGSGELLAVIEADQLGRIRTGAASGVATRAMARASASVVGVIGTGRQARTQLEAVACVRKLNAVRVFGRDADRRESYAREMSDRLGLAVRAAPTAEDAVRSADIVITATTAKEPVFGGAWLAPGAHVNAVGSNMANRRELDEATLERAATIVVDSLEQARMEAGDLLQAQASGALAWETVIELHNVVSGSREARRTEQDITVFKSTGMALWDIAVAGFVYRRALGEGRGRAVNLWGE